MTTTVTIKSADPNHLLPKVTVRDPGTGDVLSETVLQDGQEVTKYVHASSEILITEVPRPPAA